MRDFFYAFIPNLCRQNKIIFHFLGASGNKRYRRCCTQDAAYYFLFHKLWPFFINFIPVRSIDKRIMIRSSSTSSPSLSSYQEIVRWLQQVLGLGISRHFTFSQNSLQWYLKFCPPYLRDKLPMNCTLFLIKPKHWSRLHIACSPKYYSINFLHLSSKTF